MTIEEFKKQLKKISFNEDSTSKCNDMLVNLAFQYPLSISEWVTLRVAVMFFIDNFQVQIATPFNERYKWSTWNTNLRNAGSAAIVLAYAIGNIISEYNPRLK